jgi:hypothetical protein
MNWFIGLLVSMYMVFAYGYIFALAIEMSNSDRRVSMLMFFIWVISPITFPFILGMDTQVRMR